MSISFAALTEHIGAVVSGVDICAPLSSMDAGAIHAGMDKFAVLVFRDMPLTAQQQLDFTRALGNLEQSKGTSLRAASDLRMPSVFADVSNLDKHDQPFTLNDRRRLFAIGNRLWHSDSSFKVVPAKYSLLHALKIPSSGGNTEFAHMGAAYDALDSDTLSEIAEYICEHSQMYSRLQIGFTDFTEDEQQRFAPVLQRLVRTQPSGRQTLYLASHAGRIVGWSIQESLLFLRDLIEHATQRQFVYSHLWQVGDLVMWDNRQTMHRARRFPAAEPRDMRRTTLAGDGPTVAVVDGVQVLPAEARI